MISKRLAVAMAAVVLAVLGCSGGASSQDDGDIDGAAGDLAFAADGDDNPSTGSTESPAGTSATFGPDPTTADTAGTTSTTAGSGLPPVTTVASGGGGDPQGIYRGVIGTLRPDEQVVPGAAPPPTVPFGVLPLTGLPGPVPDRPAAVVKIDNGRAAAPHTGLNAADIVIEEEVEGGVTRLAAVFHSTPSIVGPVRSGRTTDVALVGGLGTPLLLYSGANDITEGILRAQPGIQNRNQATSSGYWRDSSRSAPSNLYSDTSPHWASATGGPPPVQFAFRLPGEPVPGAAATEFTVSYPASTARWTWEGGRWFRFQRGSAHRLVSGDQVSAANVVIIEAERVDTGMVDSSGGAVPEFVFVGEGRATVFTEGRRIEGRWTKPTLTSVATLTHGPGEAIELTPGRTWIQLVEAGGGSLR